MTFTLTQKKEAYQKLSPEVQDFVMSNETAEFITAALSEAGLSGKQADLADSEILYAMYGLQTLDTAMNKISKLSGKKIEELSEFKSKLQENIFSKYKELGVVQEIAPAKEEPTVITQEAKTELSHTNLPMIEEGEVAHDVPHVEEKVVSSKQQVVREEPMQKAVQTTPPAQKTPPSTHYPGGVDPYREPLN